ncbi:jerky protein homolog [Discoglossus pictus]
MEKQGPGKHTRVVLNLKQKMEICKRLDKGDTRAVLIKEFNFGLTTIYDIKAQSEKIKEFYVKAESDKGVEKRHTLHSPKMEKLDQALYEWLSLKRFAGGCISGPILQEKVREFHEKMNIEGQCSFSGGWLTRFKVRHGIRKLDLSDELDYWFAADKAIPVTHTLNTEIIEGVVNHGKMNVAEEQESDDDGCEVEKVFWQIATASFETVIAFA